MISSMPSASQLFYISNRVHCCSTLLTSFFLPSIHSFFIVISQHYRTCKANLSQSVSATMWVKYRRLMLETQLMYNRGFQLACGRGRRGKKSAISRKCYWLPRVWGWSTEQSCYYIMELCWSDLWTLTANICTIHTQWKLQDEFKADRALTSFQWERTLGHCWKINPGFFLTPCNPASWING